MAEVVQLMLPVHNRRETTERFAAALARQSFRDFRLWLLDDGSTDGTADAVLRVLPQTTVVRGTGNWWWAGALQAGRERLSRARLDPATVVGICNDDVEIADDFLDCAVREVAASPGAVLVARDVTNPSVPTGVRVDLRRLRFHPCADPVLINCLPTRGLFMRWGDFERVGGFHPRLLAHYLSDYEFTLRAGRQGMALKVADTICLKDTGTRTSGAERDALRRMSRWDCVRVLFSRRFKENPLDWSGFVLLAVPWPWRPWLLFKVWVNSLRLLADSLAAPRS